MGIAFPARVRDGLLIAFLGAFLFLYGIGGRTLQRSSEGRVARVAQEMLDRGDWLVPHLNGIPRIEKPPVGSWPTAVMAKLFSGGQVRARDALVPAALAAVALILLVYVWLSGRARETARAAGLMGALALATMVGFFRQARSAESDMLLAFCVALGFWAYERHRLEGWAAGLPLCYAALGLGISLKGHVILVIVLPVLLAWRNWERAAETPRPWKPHLLGLALLLALVLPWGIPFAMRSGITWATFYREGFERFEETAGHYEPWYFYLANVPLWALPWLLLLPLVIWFQWTSPVDEDSPRRRLWWLWFVLNLLIWSVVGSKQRHYAIGWLTPLGLLIGDGVARMIQEADEDSARPAAAWGYLATVASGWVLGAGLLAAAWLAPRESVPGLLLWSFGLVGAVGFVTGASTLMYAGGRGLFVSWWAGALCAMLLFANSWEGAQDRERSPAYFCSQVRRFVPEAARLYDVNVATHYGPNAAPDLRRAHILFYLGRNVEMVPVPADDSPSPPATEAEARARYSRRLVRGVTALLRRGPDVFVMAPTGLRDALPAELYEEPFSGEKEFAGHTWGAHLLRGKAMP
jgi:4-amino-4-deoxy-L-arabinose transferase-like glycosyltransferase